MHARDAASPRGRFDPRLYQIAVLSGLLAYGLLRLHFDIGLPRIALTLGAVLTAQAVFGRLSGGAGGGPRSALISGLSLCLLLRAGSPWTLALAALLAIGSKFVIRVGGKHVFNPTNFGIVAALLLTRGAWVSPGQWGSAAFLAFLLACAGGLVVNRAGRSDVTLAFLAFHLAILFGRSLALGEPLAIPLHRLQSGALLIFAFFMISDPRTTPSSRAGRVLFALLVALGAGYIQFRLFRTNGLLWSLAAVSPLTPILDRLLPGPRYEWRRPASASSSAPKGAVHEPVDRTALVVPPGARWRAAGAAAGPRLLRLLRRQG